MHVTAPALHLMDVLYLIVTFFLGAALAALLWSHLRLRRTMEDQESRLAALTRRVFDLEGGAAFAAPASPEPEPPPVPEPAGTDEPAHPRTPDDWEAVVGASWLNRIGALVLVIGIALFLGYSLTHLGPLGKVAIGLTAGIAMLLGGVALRSSQRYGNFATSLAGGGWSAIYFTVYASHALEPARVIADPVIGGIALLAVSAGMILHAISYESETATALAFVFGFAALNVSPLTGFSIFAAVLLALSVLLLAHLRRWFRLAIAGVVLAYLTFILRRDASGAYALWALWIQWFAFESFDIVDATRRGPDRGISRSLFFLNACGFAGAFLLQHSQNRELFLFVSGVAYLASMLVRARLLSGAGYQSALAVSAALFAGAAMEHFSGIGIPVALLVEGELILLAGHALNNGFVRGLGAAVLGLAFVRFTLIDALESTRDRDWTPMGAIFACVLAANWLLRRSGWAYVAGAGILVGMVTEAELPAEWVPFAWAAFVLAATLAGIRLQPAIGGVAAFIAAVTATADGSKAILPIVLTVCVFYACQFATRERLPRPMFSVLGTCLLTILLFREAEGRLLTVALGIQGVALLIAGMFASERVLRLSGLALFLLCIGKAFIYDLRQLDTFSRILSFIGLGLLLLGASWVYTRFRERIKRLL